MEAYNPLIFYKICTSDGAEWTPVYTRIRSIDPMRFGCLWETGLDLPDSSLFPRSPVGIRKEWPAIRIHSTKESPYFGVCLGVASRSSRPNLHRPKTARIGTITTSASQPSESATSPNPASKTRVRVEIEGFPHASIRTSAWIGSSLESEVT